VRKSISYWFRDAFLFSLNHGKFSLNQGYIRKIPLNPPLQKGEAFGMPGFIEILQTTE
jgi:hypothetical protein